MSAYGTYMLTGIEIYQTQKNFWTKSWHIGVEVHFNKPLLSFLQKNKVEKTSSPHVPTRIDSILDIYIKENFAVDLGIT